MKIVTLTADLVPLAPFIARVPSPFLSVPLPSLPLGSKSRCHPRDRRNATGPGDLAAGAH